MIHANDGLCRAAGRGGDWGRPPLVEGVATGPEPSAEIFQGRSPVSSLYNARRGEYLKRGFHPFWEILSAASADLPLPLPGGEADRCPDSGKFCYQDLGCQRKWALEFQKCVYKKETFRECLWGQVCNTPASQHRTGTCGKESLFRVGAQM